MSLFTSFFQSAKLTEILIEGHNPDARHKLSTADVDALRQHMKTGEALKAFVTGRIVGSGSGVWLLTAHQALIRNTAIDSVIAVQVSDIQHFEALRGRYGHTVRMSVQGRQHSMYGVDAELAREMHLALQALGIRSAFEDKPALNHNWMADSDSHASIQDCLSDARQRLLLA